MLRQLVRLLGPRKSPLSREHLTALKRPRPLTSVHANRPFALSKRPRHLQISNYTLLNTYANRLVEHCWHSPNLYHHPHP